MWDDWYLLHENVPMPRLTAVLEASVGAIYKVIWVMVELVHRQTDEVQRMFGTICP